MAGFEFTDKQKLAVIVLVGLSAIGLGVMQIRNRVGSQPGDVVLYEPTQSPQARVRAMDSDPLPAAEQQRPSGKVVFQVAGCVKCPGVYSLPTGSRVFEAVKSAGGAKQNADLQAINLAARIEDGSRVYVPSLSESNTGSQSAARPATAVLSGSGSVGDKLRTPGQGTVNINSAGPEELQRLPGVGPVTAQKIADYRAQIGRFRAPEQLMDVKGIGPKKFEKMRPFVAL